MASFYYTLFTLLFLTTTTHNYSYIHKTALKRAVSKEKDYKPFQRGNQDTPHRYYNKIKPH